MDRLSLIVASNAMRCDLFVAVCFRLAHWYRGWGFLGR